MITVITLDQDQDVGAGIYVRCDADELNEVFESTQLNQHSSSASLSGSTGLSCQNTRADILHAHANMQTHELRCMCL